MFKKKTSAVFAALFAATALCGCSANASPDIEPHLISVPSASPVRPIDSSETQIIPYEVCDAGSEKYRERVDTLYSVVVEDGKKPVFSDGDPLAEVYGAAVDILDRYVLNEWHGSTTGEYNTVHTIHDYLVAYVDYDFELYESYRNGDTSAMNSPSFDIDGVFLNKRAVCDGISRAFNFLCAIEGIESVRVTGTFMGVPHAWNKVRIGGVQYNVDVTADAANYSIGDSLYKQISHGYFLLGDRTFRNFRAGEPPRRHVFEGDFSGGEDYDYYADKALTVGGKTFSCVIKSAAELNALFEAVSAQKGEVGKIEVKLDFEGKINVNDGDMYAREIAAAYGKLKNADFSVTSSQKPYFQAPNGVYLFLMYK